MIVAKNDNYQEVILLVFAICKECVFLLHCNTQNELNAHQVNDILDMYQTTDRKLKCTHK